VKLYSTFQMYDTMGVPFMISFHALSLQSYRPNVFKITIEALMNGWSKTKIKALMKSAFIDVYGNEKEWSVIDNYINEIELNPMTWTIANQSPDYISKEKCVYLLD